MIKELVHDDELLAQPCEPATAQDAELAEDLIDTLLSIEDGAGLAANQIGVTKQMFAYLDERDNVHVMCNPKILFGVKAFKAEEGCLSRETYTKVTRYNKIKLQYQVIQDGALRSRTGDFQGWTAQVIQHMIDHCKGRLV